MSKKSIYPLYLTLFWILIFFIFRFVFFMFHTDHNGDALQAFISCLRMDLSMASYFIILPSLFWAIGQYFKRKVFWTNLLVVFNLIVLLFVCGIEISSIPLYKEWGTTTNARAFSYVYSPKEMWATIKDFARWYHILISLSLFSAGYLITKKLHRNIFFEPRAKWGFFIVPLIIICSAIIMTRGGLQKIPLSISDAFYSSNQNNNYTSVNKTWYFVQSLLEDQNIEDSHRYTAEELRVFYKDFFTTDSKKDSLNYINKQRPNIVFIVMESWTAGIIEPLGGLKGASSNFTKLSKEGFLFSNAYCSGFRTDQGVLSILSGVPALPSINMMNKVEIMNDLPSLVNRFNQQNYNTSVYYGGDMNFSNFRNYFLNHGINQLIDKNDFDVEFSSSDWGVPDHLVFERAHQEISDLKEPFFSTIITQSSHPPFDIPGEYAFGNSTKPEKFKSAIHYSDQALGAFFESCKNESWYENTLFVLVADHGAMHLGTVGYNDLERFHIPIMLYGPALKDSYKGKKDTTLMNQHDIPATILHLLDWNSSEFSLSKSAFQKEHPYVFFASGDAMTWSDKQHSVLFNHKSEKVYKRSCKKQQEKEMVRQGLLFLELSRKYILNIQAINNAP